MKIPFFNLNCSGILKNFALVPFCNGTNLKEAASVLLTFLEPIVIPSSKETPDAIGLKIPRRLTRTENFPISFNSLEGNLNFGILGGFFGGVLVGLPRGNGNILGNCFCLRICFCFGIAICFSNCFKISFSFKTSFSFGACFSKVLLNSFCDSFSKVFVSNIFLLKSINLFCCLGSSCSIVISFWFCFPPSFIIGNLNLGVCFAVAVLLALGIFGAGFRIICCACSRLNCGNVFDKGVFFPLNNEGLKTSTPESKSFITGSRNLKLFPDNLGDFPLALEKGFVTSLKKVCDPKTSNSAVGFNSLISEIVKNFCVLFPCLVLGNFIFSLNVFPLISNLPISSSSKYPLTN